MCAIALIFPGNEVLNSNTQKICRKTSKPYPGEKQTDTQVGLVQLIRFLVMELIYSDLNSIFNMSVIFIANYFLVGGNVPIDIKTFLTTNFVNLKIKPV
jgi:hypothetical protein